MTEEYSKIRYIKLHFILEITEPATLPTQKASMLRGGMGEMLLRTCCIADRNCENCEFEKECIVRRIMYSKMEIQPEFMSSGDSVGYVVECDDYRTAFMRGDRLEFRLLLLGKTIVYFSQILEAFYRLGMSGIGKDKARYTIVGVLNSRKDPIMDGNDIHMERFKVGRLGDYINYRMTKLIDPSCEEEEKEYRIRFTSPLSIKYNGELINAFALEAIVKAIERRIYVLCCFEGIETEKNIFTGKTPMVETITCKKVEIPRYSFRKSEKMVLWGLEGEAKLKKIDRKLLELMIAGELVHIGKNTSFGFGKYKLSYMIGDLIFSNII